jgi:hypothetical protein
MLSVALRFIWSPSTSSRRQVLSYHYAKRSTVDGLGDPRFFSGAGLYRQANSGRDSSSWYLPKWTGTTDGQLPSISSRH